MEFDTLPGGDLVREGLADLRRDACETVPALLVAIGAPRLRRIGIDVPAHLSISDPEHLLHSKLAESEPDSAHSRYNALIRRLVAFERAVECAS